MKYSTTEEERGRKLFNENALSPKSPKSKLVVSAFQEPWTDQPINFLPFIKCKGVTIYSSSIKIISFFKDCSYSLLLLPWVSTWFFINNANKTVVKILFIIKEVN